MEQLLLIGDAESKSSKKREKVRIKVDRVEQLGRPLAEHQNIYSLKLGIVIILLQFKQITKLEVMT